MSYSPELENSILRNLLAQTTAAYDEQMGALFGEKELAQVTLASIRDGVITTDAEATVKYVNPAAERLTGWLSREAIGKPLDDVFHLLDDQDDTSSPVLRNRLESDPPDRERPFMLVRTDGNRLAVEFSAAPIRNHRGERIGFVIVFQDVSERRFMALQMAHQATHDSLTGLLNRKAFDEQLQEVIRDVQQRDVMHALCYLDLDQFKLINDTCGHLAGDQLLENITALLQDEIRETELLARLGGDEFALLLRNCSADEARRFGEHIQSVLRDYRFQWESATFDVTASLGLVPITSEFNSVDRLMSAADHSCYLAKEKGRNRIQVYQRDDIELLRRHGEMNWVARIQNLLDEDRFRLYGQRIQPLSFAKRDRLCLEVLLRVQDNGRTLLPADVIRSAERYGLMGKIDRWVITETFRMLRDQPSDLLASLEFCSINLSALSLSDDSLLAFLCEQLDSTRLSPAQICLEMTETAAVSNLPQAKLLMTRLRSLGYRFALDDFGSGMSSFGYLKELPVSFLKIDGKFINDIVTDPHDHAMVEAIHQLGRALGIDTIAEAVTTIGILDRLRKIGVDYAQGFGISHPTPLSELFRLPVAP